MLRNLLRIVLAMSMIMAVWAILQFDGWRSGIMLAYAVLVAGACRLTLKALGLEGGKIDLIATTKPSGGTPEEIILQILREKGRAKRQDIHPHLSMSKSTLVRLLDEMEKEGRIEQIGDRKGSYYRLKQG